MAIITQGRRGRKYCWFISIQLISSNFELHYIINLYKFALDLLVPAPQMVYLCDLSEIFTICSWHIEVVVNCVVEYARYSRNGKNQRWMTFFVQIDVCFSCRMSNFYHRNLKKKSLDAQWNFAKDSNFRIFIWEFSK